MLSTVPNYFLLLITLLVQQRSDSTYSQHIAAARVTAPAVAEQHLQHALALLHGHPDAHYLLARNAVRLRQPDAAVAHLRTIAAMGLSYDASRDTTFASLHDRADFKQVIAEMSANRQPRGQSATLATFDDPDLLTEDVAYDASAKCSTSAASTDAVSSSSRWMESRAYSPS
jgi:hypothetical protein